MDPLVILSTPEIEVLRPARQHCPSHKRGELSWSVEG